MAFAVVASLAACSKDDKNVVPVIQLGKNGPGTCINAPATLGPEVKKLPTVDCAVAHTHEVFAVVPYVEQVEGKPDKVAGDKTLFPGLEAVDAYAQRACITEFEPYVGVSAFDSTLTFSWLDPTLASWNGSSKDRSIICVLGKFDGNTMTGSKKGSNE